MTITDLLIIGSVGYSLYVFVSHQRNFSLSMASIGLIAVILGLSLIALFYVADLVTMHVFPLFMPMSQAMAVMKGVHLNSFWIVALVGIGAISFGFAATNRNAARVVEKLRDSEERYAVAVSGTNEGLWDWNILTDESYFAPRWKQILGFEDHELENVRQTFADALHPDDRDRVMAAVRTHLDARVPYDAEFRLRHKDGHYVWIHSKGQAIWDEQGNPKRMAGSISDITGRKKAEEEIAKQSALLETTFETMNQGICVHDADLKLVAFNRYYVDLMDYPPGFIRLGMHYEEIARFKAERGDYGPGDMDEHVRKRVLARRDRKPKYNERTWPNGKVTLMRRDVLPDGGYVTTFTDITERKRAEEAVRESEARFRAVVDNSPTKIHIKDADGRYTLVNPVAEKLFGFTDEEARGKTSYDIFPKEVADAFTAHDRAVAESGEMVEQVEHFTQEDGEHTYLTVKFPILDGQGEFAGVAAIGTDITERKRAEEEIARKSALLETTFENMSQGICVHDADLELVAFNQHYVDLMGFPPGFLRLGMPYEEITRYKAERGHYGPGDVDEHVRERVLARRARKPNRKERTQPNGRVTLMRRDVLPDGGFVATYTDITERKRAEKEIARKSALLETTFENMSQGISVYDADLKLVAFNQNYVDLWRLPPGFVRVGMTFEEISRFKAERGDYGPGEVETLVKESVAAMWDVEALQPEYTAPDGNVFVVWRAPMPGGGIINTFTDITEQERAKTEMLRAKEQAELSDRAKSEFLANMSHELRTPLNAILGFSELMGKATLGPLGNPKYEEYARDINDSGRHLLGLIDDILDISKIEAGKLELDEEAIDIARVIRSCMVLVKERAENSGVNLKTDLPDGLPALHADKRKLKQILVNLLSNAVKFTPAGGEVTLKAWWREDSGYVFQVIDTGIGMALADIPKALSLFGQVDSDLDRKYEGTGLGLPLTKQLVEMHGGSLDLQSEEGAGTTVTVRFPKERIVHVAGAEATGTPAA